jgi:DNA repair protein RecO (recombination protein O)
MSQVSLFNAYILHRRDFRDTSFIIDFFTEEQGVLSTVAKGAKRPKSKLRTGLHYFSPLLIDCYGKNELLGLKSVENNGPINNLNGKLLLTLLYVNELLNKLLHKYEPHPLIFNAYKELIAAVTMNADLEIALRKFEMLVLQDLGYGLSLNIDSSTGDDVVDEANYQFYLEEGIKPSLAQGGTTKRVVLTGDILKKIQQQDFSDKAALISTKLLFRQIFNELLQFKPLNSRQLFTYNHLLIEEKRI